jgi:hypothetical protein
MPPLAPVEDGDVHHLHGGTAIDAVDTVGQGTLCLAKMSAAGTVRWVRLAGPGP